MTNKEKGDLYEEIIKNDLNKEDNAEAHIWSNIPEEWFIESELLTDLEWNRLYRKLKKSNKQEFENMLHDIGIDVIQKKDNKYTLVQCKNGYNNGVTIGNLAGMYARMFNNPHLKGQVYYTDKISQNIIDISKNPNLEFIKRQIDTNIADSNNMCEKEENIYVLYEHQQEAVNKLKKHFKTESKGIICGACGIGKTLISCMFSIDYKHIILISPYKQYAEQNLKKYEDYLGNKDVIYILIDSDGTRDVYEIEKNIKKHKSKKIIFSATYKSVDVINNIMSKLDNNRIFIIDEFHNLSRKNLGMNMIKVSNDGDLNSESEEDEEENTDEIYNLISSKNKILYMSATPRVYDIEGEEDDATNESLFGNIIYSMSFSNAIKNKYITDYKIFIPSITENDSEYKNKIEKEIDIKTIDSTIMDKCMFLYKGMIYNGSKKIIVYCRSVDELMEFHVILEHLNNFYCMDLSLYYITSETHHSKNKLNPAENSREWILIKFSTCKGRAIMLSVRILDECIDIPACDSIYITYSCESKIRIIQRLCRATRIDKNNKNKVAHIYLWCDEYKNILETLSGLKEYDTDLRNKINIQNSCIGTRKQMNTDTMKKNIDDCKKYIISIKEYNITTWFENLEKLKKYIDEYKNTPTSGSDQIKKMHRWTSNQKRNYKQCLQNMKNSIIYNAWKEFVNDEKYKKYFYTEEELWHNNLEIASKYLDEHKKRPTKRKSQIGSWLTAQFACYNAYRDRMKYPHIRQIWENFIKKYSSYFMRDKEKWYTTLDNVKHHIDNTKKRPLESRNEDERLLAQWICTQIKNSKKRTQIMKNDDIYSCWTNFVNSDKYIMYFSKKESWHKKLQYVKSFFDEYCIKLNMHDNGAYYRWLFQQKKEYKNKKGQFENNDICDEWEKFINDPKYKQYIN